MKEWPLLVVIDPDYYMQEVVSYIQTDNVVYKYDPVFCI